MASLRVRLEGWLRRGRPQPVASEAADAEPDWSTPADTPPGPDDAVIVLLRRVEDTALSLYQAHGLPVRHGHYARSPKNPRWAFVAETLSPEERWALAIAQPADAGWRFALLDQLGDESAIPDVAGASRLLAGVRQLRASLRDRDVLTLRADLEMAIRLGADWQTLRRSLDGDTATAAPSARLKPRPPAKIGAPAKTGAKARK